MTRLILEWARPRGMGAALTPNTRQPSRRRSGRVESSGERRAADARLASQTRDGDEATRVGMNR